MINITFRKKEKKIKKKKKKNHLKKQKWTIRFSQTAVVTNVSDYQI